MIERLLTLPNDENFFLFGARGVGKTTLLKSLPWFLNSLYINLLKPSEENRFSRDPEELISIVQALPPQVTHVIIDEVQKLPTLLDLVHELIETTDKYFILTGSSARKLKHGGANLLAGRAFVYNLFPLTASEIPKNIPLIHCLQWGTLPKILEFNTHEKKALYLEAYTNTYLKEEIWAEQFIRDLAPFRRFLEVAAQSNGKLINFSNLARDVGVSDQTIQKYYAILEDTLIGFFLEAFQNSFRKRLSKTPKFYFFDTGVVRALTNHLNIPLLPGTSYFGEIFEHFIILQCIQMARYYHRDYRFSYLKTKDDVEIDLVIERPGLPLLLLEIKSTQQVQAEQLRTLKKISEELSTCEAICLSCDPYAKIIDGIKIFPWQQGLQYLFHLV